MFAYLTSRDFIDTVERLLGISPLYADPGLSGGGWHAHGRGGKNNVHLDYSIHPKLDLERRVNLLVYMNSNWKAEWGGVLSLWDQAEGEKTPGTLIKEVVPQFNRAVLFDTTQNSSHGLPKAIECPEGEICAAFVSGAVNLIRMSVIHELGGFDENLYLYFDDDDLCMRMRAARYPLILTPRARIMHINAGLVRPSLHYKWEKFWNYGWARLYIEKKYKGGGAMWGLAARHILRFFFKALINTLFFKFEKAWRDWARLGAVGGDAGTPDRCARYPPQLERGKPEPTSIEFRRKTRVMFEQNLSPSSFSSPTML